jgi:hypothetical protein
MALTLLVKSMIIENSGAVIGTAYATLAASDTAIAAVLNGVVTSHIYSVTIVPISNTLSRIIMVYD